MITKMLFNINNIFYYLFLLMILCIVCYLMYKVFILENDLYFINERIYNLEMNNNSCSIKKNNIIPNVEEFNMNDIIMNQIFDDKEQIAINKDIDIINIEDIPIELAEEVKSEPIFDLKKDVVIDDKESIISSNLNKKKLQKLNLDKLKDKCIELELNTEGTKAQLIDRILEKELN